MKKSLIITTLSIFLTMEVCGQESQWFTPFSGSTKISNQEVTIDNQGNSYVLSSFEGEATIGKQEVKSTSHTAFIVKVDPSGEKVLWMSQLETEGNAWGRKIAVDKNGNVAIIGDFRGSVGSGNKKVSTTGDDRDWYVAYFSAGGELEWIKSGGGDNAVFEIGIGVGFDDDGNVYATGNTCGFEGESIDNAVFYAQTRTSNPDGKASFDGKPIDGVVATFYTSVIVKISPSGEVLWVNTEIDTASGGMDVDAEGNVYVNAGYGNYANIFGEVYSSGGNGSIAVIKIDREGNKGWIKTFGPKGEGTPGQASKDVSLASAQAIAVSRTGHLLVLGGATGTVYEGTEQISGKIKTPLAWVVGLNPDGSSSWFAENAGLTTGGFDVDDEGNAYLALWGLTGSFFGEKVKRPSVFKISKTGDIDWVYEGKISDKKKKYTMLGYSSLGLNRSDNSIILAGIAQFQDISTWSGMNKTVTTTKTYSYLTLQLIK